MSEAQDFRSVAVVDTSTLPFPLASSESASINVLNDAAEAAAWEDHSA